MTANQLAKHWSAALPTDAARIERGLAIVAEVKRSTLATGVFYVNGREAYTVVVDLAELTGSCTCPDHTHRKLRCKHVWAAILATTASVASAA